MKNEHIFELMGTIPPDLVEEADIQAPARRRLPRLARTGLIAACLCLALIGTAAAVHYSNVRIVGGDDGFTEMKGGIVLHPYDSFSDEIKAIADEHTILPFSSWQEAEDFIGVDLMNNPVLDASPAQTFSLIIEEGEKTVAGVCLVSTSPGLYYVRTQGCFEMENVDITVENHYYTQHKHWDEWEDWDETFYGVRPPEGTDLAQETYTAPSGLTAQLMAIDRPGGHRDTYLATFSLDGTPFVVKANSHNSLEEARAALIQILDGFILD